MVKHKLFGVENRPQHIFQSALFVVLGFHVFQGGFEFFGLRKPGIPGEIKLLDYLGERSLFLKLFGDGPVAVGQFVFDLVLVGHQQHLG